MHDCSVYSGVDIIVIITSILSILSMVINVLTFSVLLMCKIMPTNVRYFGCCLTAVEALRFIGPVVLNHTVSWYLQDLFRRFSNVLPPVLVTLLVVLQFISMYFPFWFSRHVTKKLLRIACFLACVGPLVFWVLLESINVAYPSSFDHPISSCLFLVLHSVSLIVILTTSVCISARKFKNNRSNVRFGNTTYFETHCRPHVIIATFTALIMMRNVPVLIIAFRSIQHYGRSHNMTYWSCIEFVTLNMITHLCPILYPVSIMRYREWRVRFLQAFCRLNSRMKTRIELMDIKLRMEARGIPEAVVAGGRISMQNDPQEVPKQRSSDNFIFYTQNSSMHYLNKQMSGKELTFKMSGEELATHVPCEEKKSQILSGNGLNSKMLCAASNTILAGSKLDAQPSDKSTNIQLFGAMSNDELVCSSQCSTPVSRELKSVNEIVLENID